jgi:hypothetical protein
MRAGTQLALVLLGGGTLAGGVAVSAETWRACGYARLHDQPADETRCGGSRLGMGGWHGGFGGVRGGPVAGYASGWHSVTRGGFGLFGLHFGGFHG